MQLLKNPRFIIYNLFNQHLLEYYRKDIRESMAELSAAIESNQMAQKPELEDRVNALLDTCQRHGFGASEISLYRRDLESIKKSDATIMQQYRPYLKQH